VSFISLTEIKSDSDAAALAMSELLALLMESIGKHAIEEDPADLHRFQQRVAIETQRLKTTDQARPAVEAVIDLMAQHNESVKADHRAYSAELNKAMRMMVDTIGQVSKSSQAAVHQLTVIEKNLEEVTASNDATKIRSKLGLCLKMIREQSETLKVQASEQLSTLKSFVAASPVGQQQSAIFDEPVDAVTGLPTRSFAENIIQKRLENKIDCMIGMVTINRFGGLKSRFGQGTVDELIKEITRQLAQRLPEATTLCRWSAGSFVAITDIVSSYSETSQQWRRVNGLKLEKQIDHASRTAFVVLNTSVLVEHLRPLSSKREMIQTLDRFASLQSGEAAA